MSNKNEVFEYLVAAMHLTLDERKAHKQQCEDLEHEVQSLKNQLRDASALVAELQKGVDIPSKADPNVNTAAWKLYDALTAKGEINGAQFNILKVAFYDAMLTALGKDGGDKAYVERETLRHLEQSGCRKEDTQECEHDWLYSKYKSGLVCFKCGACKECDHNWVMRDVDDFQTCSKCGAIA